jgi:F-type H+-transporting ATPase subunit epsilon
VAAAGTTAYVVTGGFAEITASGVSVLAERAVPVAEANAALMDGLMADARESVAAGMDKDTGDKLLADMQSLRVAAGL